ncbi:hypothetical protein FOCC_FOCC011150 [Frankliniella occidentalis]|nr:hypothetical protein FOCC_FOCC011150 [Frankliniella occidentalis]
MKSKRSKDQVLEMPVRLMRLVWAWPDESRHPAAAWLSRNAICGSLLVMMAANTAYIFSGEYESVINVLGCVGDVVAGFVVIAKALCLHRHGYEVTTDHPNVDLGDNANFGNAANENNSNDNNANGDNDVNLEDFISNLCENVEIYAALLYAIPSVTRKLVDNIISYTSELISNSVSLLKKCTMHILSKFPEMYDDFHVDVQKLTNMFEVIGNPFEFMSTEYRRLCTLAEKGVYIKPEPFEMGHVDKYIQIEGRVQLVRSPVYGYTIPLREVLQQFLQRPGVLEEILNFMNSLQNVNGRVSHFLQGHLWERFDFGPNEVGNKPPTCKFSASSLSDCSLNLSAAEWLCLGRSLGIMIGDLVQETNQVWRLYVIINEIILICSSPFYEVGVENYLLRLVQDHHELYTRFFGDLKPKHHLMLHYAEHFKNFGPLTAFSALLSERNHRRGKLYARVCNSRINLALTCAIKFQLYLAERLMRPDGRQLIVHTKCKRVLLASLAYHAMFAHLLPFPDNMLHTVDRVEVKGTIYVPKAVLVVGVGADLPLLGKIIYNIMHNDGVVFVVQMYKVVGYLEHVCAYEVEDGDQWCCLRHENVRYYDPLHLRTTSDGKKVVGLTYSL